MTNTKLLERLKRENPELFEAFREAGERFWEGFGEIQGGYLQRYADDPFDVYAKGAFQALQRVRDELKKEIGA